MEQLVTVCDSLPPSAAGVKCAPLTRVACENGSMTMQEEAKKKKSVEEAEMFLKKGEIKSQYVNTEWAYSTALNLLSRLS